MAYCRAGFFVFLTATLICGAALAQSSEQPRVEQPKSDIPQNEGQKQQNSANQSPIVINVVPAPKTETERSEEAKDRAEKAEADRKLADYTGELALFTKGLFFATVVLGVATVGLLVLGFFQSRDARAGVRAAQASADAAELSAQAAVKSAEIAAKSQAASLVLESIEQMIGKERETLNDVIIVQGLLQNTGNTTARNAIAAISMRTIGVDEPTDHIFSNQIFENEDIGADVGPKISIRTPDVSIALSAVKEIWDKKKRIFLRIAVQYETIFEPRVFVKPPPYDMEVQAFINPYTLGLLQIQNVRILRFNIVPQKQTTSPQQKMI